jgi:hypothetical protein
LTIPPSYLHKNITGVLFFLSTHKESFLGQMFHVRYLWIFFPKRHRVLAFMSVFASPILKGLLLNCLSQNNLPLIFDHSPSQVSVLWSTIPQAITHHLVSLQQEPCYVVLATSSSYSWCVILVVLYPLTPPCFLTINSHCTFLYVEFSLIFLLYYKYPF